MKLRTEMRDNGSGFVGGKHLVADGDWHHDALAAHALMQAIVDEPELPGGMPEEMWDAICNDRDAATEAFRIVVRQTKEGITTRADEILAGWTGAGE